MSNIVERFQWLAQQFDALVQKLGESPSQVERKQLLQRMKILIDEIDGQIFTALKRESQNTSKSSDQPSSSD
jgi:hypothetical protein